MTESAVLSNAQDTGPSSSGPAPVGAYEANMGRKRQRVRDKKLGEIDIMYHQGPKNIKWAEHTANVDVIRQAFEDSEAASRASPKQPQEPRKLPHFCRKKVYRRRKMRLL